MKEYNPAIKQGIRMGVVVILLFLVIYAIDPMFFAKPKGWMVMLAANFLAIPIVFMILGCRDTKVSFTPYNFGNAFNAAFFTGIIAAVMSLMFQLIFVSVIDTAWEGELMEEVRNSTEQFMIDMGAPQETIDAEIAKAEAKGAYNPKGFLGALKSTGGLLFWYALLALIIGSIQKDKKQEDLIA